MSNLKDKSVSQLSSDSWSTVSMTAERSRKRTYRESLTHIFLNSTQRLLAAVKLFEAKYGFNQLGLIWYFFTCEIWCIADVSNICPSSEQSYPDIQITQKKQVFFFKTSLPVPKVVKQASRNNIFNSF